MNRQADSCENCTDCCGAAGGRLIEAVSTLNLVDLAGSERSEVYTCPEGD